MAAFSMLWWNRRHFHFLWWSVRFSWINNFEKHSEGLSNLNLFPFMVVLSSQLHSMCIFLFWQGEYPLYVLRKHWSSTVSSLEALPTLTGELQSIKKINEFESGKKYSYQLFQNSVADTGIKTVSLTFNNVEGHICVLNSTATDICPGVVIGHLTNSQRAVPVNTEFMVIWRIYVSSTHHLTI